MAAVSRIEWLDRGQARAIVCRCRHHRSSAAFKNRSFRELVLVKARTGLPLPIIALESELNLLRIEMDGGVGTPIPCHGGCRGAFAVEAVLVARNAAIAQMQRGLVDAYWI